MEADTERNLGGMSGADRSGLLPCRFGLSTCLLLICFVQQVGGEAVQNDSHLVSPVSVRCPIAFGRLQRPYPAQLVESCLERRRDQARQDAFLHEVERQATDWALSLGSCDHLGPVRALTWANGWTSVPPGSVAFTVVPRCSPLDLVRLWCGGWRAACRVSVHACWPSRTGPTTQRQRFGRSCSRSWLC